MEPGARHGGARHLEQEQGGRMPGARAAVGERVVVLGAGLAGLMVARQLCSAGLGVQMLEARSRVGGRLMTVGSTVVAGGWFDLGATWHWEGQVEIASLAADLGLRRYPQFGAGSALHEESVEAGPRRVEATDEEIPPFRIDGGCEALARGLASGLPVGCLRLGVAGTAVESSTSALTVTAAAQDGSTSTLVADFVVVAVPPRLVLQNIDFSPALPSDVIDVMGATPTWMGDVVKIVAVYERSFWREAGLSGSAFSHAGPLYEVHDASAPSGVPAALWGLAADDPGLRSLGPEERVTPVLAQLARLFGPEALEPIDYFERDWSSDPNTNEAVTDLGVRPLDFGHPRFSEALMDGRLLWAGAETEGTAGGHMEGALRSARRAAEHIL